MIENPTGRARLAIIAVIVWLVADAVYSLSGVLVLSALGALGTPLISAGGADDATGIASVVMLVTMVAAVVFSARWILLVARNAHRFSDAMTISPGWAVGWYFVPIANLWKPFQAMREIWRASVNPSDPQSVAMPGFMGFWWALWVTTSILSNLSGRLSMDEAPDALMASAWLDIASFVCDMPLAWLFITLIRRLTDVQLRGQHYSETFA